MTRVAVVGGGITGLAAALRLRDRLGPDAQVTVFEAGPTVGGKLSTGTLAGLVAEQGADAFLVREPAAGRAQSQEPSAAVELARRVGLELVHPQPVPPGLWVDGALRPFPTGTLMGVPGDPAATATVAPVAPGRDLDSGQPVLAPGVDTTVGELVRARLGDQVVDRLVDPMLGGVYAGRADRLSLAATMPGLAAAARQESTLAAAVRAARRPAGGPVFASVPGGLGQLAAATTTASQAELRVGTTVRGLARTGSGWRLAAATETFDVDAVVLALPARPAARLLAGVGVGLDPVDYASVALVTLALPEFTQLPEWSGFLVPATQGLAVKAVTFLTRKWEHLRQPGKPVLVRASVGRYGEVGVLRLTDEALVDRVRGDLATVLGDLPAPVASRVRRWGGALPQYAPGHLDRVAAARAQLPPTLRLAGAGYDGVGIAACVRSAHTAADQLAG